MKIGSNLRAMCNMRAFEWCAKVYFNLEIKELVKNDQINNSGVISDLVIKEIKKVCIGKEYKNPIELTVNFEDNQSIINFFNPRVKVSYDEVDINSKVKNIVVPIKIIYKNYEQVIEYMNNISDLRVESVIGYFNESEPEEIESD